MPLRSVEAASRDDAIAAAREQFGPSARVVGVRRVRSGGVLGFFATERYVAEVAPDPGFRPPVPLSGRSSDAALAPSPLTSSLLPSSPLASAAPATARPTAPARNGAAAYAAAADSSPSPARSAVRQDAPARSAALLRAPADADPTPRSSAAADEARLSELVGLLATETEPPAPAYNRASFPRATVVRSARDASPAYLDDDDEDDEQDAPPVIAPAAPSPFTAALARMVSGDRDVRQAVEEALEQPADASSRTDVGPWPTWSGPVRTAEPSVPSTAARQKEETVGDQVIAPPSMPAARPTEVPAWAAEPDAAADSSREEAIAEVLRSALAQGHSDEALAGILRKVLAGASPQTALTAPELAEPALAEPEPAYAEPTRALDDLVLPNVVVDLRSADVPDITPDDAADLAREAATNTVVDLPVVSLPVADLPVVDLPVADLPVVSLPVVSLPVVDLPLELPVVELPAVSMPVAEVPVAELPVAEPPVAEPPVAQPSVPEPLVTELTAADRRVDLFGAEPAAPAFPALPTWYESTSQSTLWGALPATPSALSADAPIWADVVRDERVPAPVVEQPAWSLFGTLPEAQSEATIAPEGVAGSLRTHEPVAAETAAPEPVVAEVDVPEIDVPESAVPETAETATDSTTVSDEAAAEAEAVQQSLLEMAPLLARTASDPAPMSLDATTVMPPLSLLPPLPGTRGRGRPPVPPVLPRASARQAAAPAPAESAPMPPAPAEPETVARPAVVARSLATVTRLPVAPLMATPEIPEAPVPADVLEPAPVEAEVEAPVEAVVEAPVEAPVKAVVEAPLDSPVEASVGSPIEDRSVVCAQAAVAPEVTVVPAPAPFPVPAGVLPAPSIVRVERKTAAEPADIVARLDELGLPSELLGSAFAEEVAAHGTYAALTRALGLRLPQAPELPTGAGEVLFLVGPGVETLRAARSLAASLRLDPERVQWATRGDLAGLVPEASRMATIDAAIDRRQAAAGAGTLTIVAVDAPMRTDAYWMAQMLAIWSPVAVWAVVEATRKPDDLEPWLEGLSRVDALVVQDTDLSADPAAVLRRVAAPVAVLDGVRATPHRWASLLCERLEGTRS